ncbi:glycoside hydrolase [Apodospora peruviana]|uniref:lytic cellulose monooxygenase (C4-dehydrogenating) n=1 Tax=Apodospora peruviana TaxID=516989 RepID=A0AAE0I6H8_9PEZI|nr:glycoside hydrolase [Apodospora peruviana]
MGYLHFLAVFAAMAPLTQCHYTFVRIKANGEWQEPMRYIRNLTSPFDEKQLVDSNMIWREWNWPTYTLDFPDSVRCGRGNLDHANATEVLTVKAGDTVEIAQQRSPPHDWTHDMFYGCPDDRGTCDPRPGYKQDFNHPGPLIVHLSKVPDGQDIHTYDGSGNWIKIHSRGLGSLADERPLKWELFTDVPPHLTFKIPPQTPAGQYLMRMDVVMSGVVTEWTKPGDLGILAQFYPSCAQLNILSNATTTTTLPKGVAIPEIFAPDRPGMTTSYEMYHFRTLDENYTYPGGPVWTGERLVEDKPN